MKKYIFGTILAAMLTAAWIFLANPPDAANPAASTTIAITFRFPAGYELTEGAPFAMTWQAESPDGTRTIPVKVRNFNPLIAPYPLAFKPPAGSVATRLKARLYYCDKITRMCFQDDFESRVPLLPGNAAASFVWEIKPRAT